MTFERSIAPSRWSTTVTVVVLAAIAALFAGAAVYVGGSISASGHPVALTLALAFDLTVLAPFLYYVVFVRGRGWPAASTVLVVLAGAYATQAVVPDTSLGLVKALPYVAWALEVVFVGTLLTRAAFAVRRAYQTSRAGVDLFDEIRTRVRSAIPSRRVADALAYEVMVFYYALFAWGSNGPENRGSKPGTRYFTIHRTSGYYTVAAVIVGVAVVELVAVHFVINHLWGATAAGIHAALGVYGVLWLVGDWKALSRRGVEVTPEVVHVRCGIRWTARVPRDQIEAAFEIRSAEEGDEVIDVSPVYKPNVAICTSEPVEITGIFGRTRTATTIALHVDEPEDLLGML